MMNRTEIVLPVLAAVEPKTARVGGPATAEGAARKLAGTLPAVHVDEATFLACVAAAQSLLMAARGAAPEKSPITVESMAVQLGVSVTGRVGFLGTGAEAELAASVQLTMRFADPQNVER